MTQYYLGPPPMNPLSRLFAAIVAALALAGAFFFGIFVLAFAVGAGLVAWLVIWARMWWIRRKLERGGFGVGPAPGARHADREARSGGEVIDGEYEVVEKEEHD